MKKINRRNFIGTTAIGVTMATGANSRAESALPSPAGNAIRKEGRPLFVATWPFGKPACEKAVPAATAGSMLDGIEQGIHVTESDIANASVGIGGIPCADGQVELDACIMSGPDHNAGAVAGIRDILHPVSVARKVMETTPHVMLVGDGARTFALENGFEATDLLTENQKWKWKDWKKERDAAGAEGNPPPQLTLTEHHHDTIAMLGIDATGDLFGGCSTSGWGYKIPGRVGDSPIIGSGLYVDNTVGAAGATGLGENVMRYCGSFLVVEMMRAGASPVDAVRQAIERIVELDPKGIEELSINFIALNKNGEFGAAGTDKGFQYAWASSDGSGILEARSLTENAIGPEGGNTDR